MKIWYNENWEPVRLDIDPLAVVRSAVAKVTEEELDQNKSVAEEEDDDEDMDV